jgi:hypothetical protein
MLSNRDPPASAGNVSTDEGIRGVTVVLGPKSVVSMWHGSWLTTDKGWPFTLKGSHWSLRDLGIGLPHASLCIGAHIPTSRIGDGTARQCHYSINTPSTRLMPLHFGAGRKTECGICHPCPVVRSNFT